MRATVKSESGFAKIETRLVLSRPTRILDVPVNVGPSPALLLVKSVGCDRSAAVERGRLWARLS